MQIGIQAKNIEWQVQRQRSGRLVAWCDVLGLTVEGDNEADLSSVIGEAMHVLFVDLLEDGDLPRFLADHGWTANGPLPGAPPDDGVVFDVPFALLPNLAAKHP